MVAKKEVVNINIFEIYAAKKLFFGPPVVWELEAAIDVSYSDGSCEIQYASTIDMEEAGWMVMTKRIKDIANDENVDPYIVACRDDKCEALDSPYVKVISELPETNIYLVKYEKWTGPRQVDLEHIKKFRLNDKQG